MAFFKFRKGAAESKGAPPPPSLESIRRRAKYRLVGASVLVLAGVIVFPLLLESQPRPIAINTPIEIPDRNKVAPLQLPNSANGRVLPASGAPAPTEPAPAPAPQPAAAPAQQEKVITETAPAAVQSKPNRPVDHASIAPVVTNTVASPASKTSVTSAPAPQKPDVQKADAASTPKASASAHITSKPVPAAKPASAVAKPAAAAASDAARARALLEDAGNKSPAGSPAKASASESSASAPAEQRFVVQVGAFAEAARAQEVRLKLEHAGLKTYTHVAETKDGRRIRVRVGPFSSKEEADKAAAKVKKLELPAAVLIL